MKILFKISQILIAAVTFCLCGCATTTIKQTWSSPNPRNGPAQRVAVLTVDDRGIVRQALENRFVNQLRAGGQDSLVTHELLSLAEIKASKEAAVASLTHAGVDAIFIIRLVDAATYDREMRATPALFVSTATGYGGYGWYDYYSVAFVDMGVVWSSNQRNIFLDTSMHDLKSEGRIWSCLTETVLKDDVDKLITADDFVGKVLAAARKDGMIR
jgi:hypothetical protein